jgi:3-methyladenine DNA glycosylase AlkD
VTLPAPERLCVDLAASLATHVDAQRAEDMRAYMKNHFVYFGVPAPQRRASMKAVLKHHDLSRRTEVPTEWLSELALRCWEGPMRELQYVAGDVLEFFERSLDESMLLSTIEPMFDADTGARNWWDTVDLLVGAAVSPIGTQFDISSLMRSWVIGGGVAIDRRAEGPFSPELAKIRCAILHQLGRGASTDEGLLFEFCERRAVDREFFVGKAIGWALREYSYVAPEAVERFVDATPTLTKLARREGMKVIVKRRTLASK